MDDMLIVGPTRNHLYKFGMSHRYSRKQGLSYLSYPIQNRGGGAIKKI
jgi:hypothetical protein